MIVKFFKPYDNLDARRLPGGKRELLAKIVFSIDADMYVIPSGFVTDYSSLPWFVAWTMNWRKVDIAGVVHDWFYKEGSLPKREADRIWKAVAMNGDSKHYRVNAIQGYAGLAGLTIFGWFPWWKHRRADKN